MKLTVAICTWNRSELLKGTLEKMTTLVIPRGVEWELLVINNNSTDNTAKVIRSISDRLPVRSVFEPRPGHSNARNRAVREASGDYILWTDDDVLVDKQWIVEYNYAFQRWPDSAIFGGRIEPHFTEKPPQWLRQLFHRVTDAYALRNLGKEPIKFTPSLTPFGANYVTRAKEQRQYQYDPLLGLRPNSTIRGEETAVINAMLAAGITGWWVPSASVKHVISKDRQTRGYLCGYYLGRGEEIGREWCRKTDREIIRNLRFQCLPTNEANFEFQGKLVQRKHEYSIEQILKNSFEFGLFKGILDFRSKLKT